MYLLGELDKFGLGIKLASPGGTGQANEVLTRGDEDMKR